MYGFKKLPLGPLFNSDCYSSLIFEKNGVFLDKVVIKVNVESV